MYEFNFRDEINDKQFFFEANKNIIILHTLHFCFGKVK